MSRKTPMRFDGIDRVFGGGEHLVVLRIAPAGLVVAAVAVTNMSMKVWGSL